MMICKTKSVDFPGGFDSDTFCQSCLDAGLPGFAVRTVGPTLYMDGRLDPTVIIDFIFARNLSSYELAMFEICIDGHIPPPLEGGE